MSKGEDKTILGQPILLRHTGVRVLDDFVKNGTPEIVDALYDECNVLLECKVCQNIFRAVPNFLGHKREYCKQRHCENICLPSTSSHLSEKQTIVVIQPTAPREVQPEVEQESRDKDEKPTEEAPQKGSRKRKATNPMSVFDPKKLKSISVFEQMKSGSYTGGESVDYKFYTNTVELQNKKDEMRKTSTLTIEDIPNTTYAKAITVSKEDDCAAPVVEAKPARKGRGRPKKQKMAENEATKEILPIKVEPEDLEVKQEPEYMEGVLVVEPEEAKGHIHMNLRQRGGSKGGAATTLLEQLKERADCDVNTLKCLKCKQPYASVKTLFFHMTSRHAVGGKRKFYPCPDCTQDYAQVWGTTRHMQAAHKYTQAQAQAQSQAIREKVFYRDMDDTSNETKSVQKSSADKVEATQVFHQCRYCTKTFLKKNGLDRHYRICPEAKALMAENNSSLSTCPPPSPCPPISSLRLRASLTTTTNESEFTADQIESIRTIVDESELICRKCKKMFETISNLHRHAIRHLGWVRFRCERCRFLCYNKSECRRHLKIVHAVEEAIDSNIIKLTEEEVEEERRNNIRVEMASKGLGRGGMRTRGALNRSVLVTRSGTYTKPSLQELSNGSNGGAEMDADEQNSVAGGSNATSGSSSPVSLQQQEKDDDDDIMQVKEDVSKSRNRRAGKAPKRVASNELISTENKLDNTPATARPASHILSSPAAKSPVTYIMTTTTNSPTKVSQHTASPSKSSSAVNILSKSSTVPKCSLSGGVTTVRLPVFTHCRQVQSGGAGSAFLGNQKKFRTIAPCPTATSQPPQSTTTIVTNKNISQSPACSTAVTLSHDQVMQLLGTSKKSQVLGPNFQLPGSSGSAQVRTVAVSSLPASSGFYKLTSSNALSSFTSTSVLSSGNGGNGIATSSSTGYPSQIPSRSDGVPTSSTVGGMPVLDPVQPISVDSTAPTVLQADAVQVSLDSSCQLSPAMPSLAPIATYTLGQNVSVSSSAMSFMPQRSQTQNGETIEVNPAADPSSPVAMEEDTQMILEEMPQTISGGELGQVELALSETVGSVQDLDHGEMLEHVASSASMMSMGGQETETTEDMEAGNGNNKEELITFVASTENSCSLEQNPENANQLGEYIVSITPASQVPILQHERDVSEDANVTVTTTALETVASGVERDVAGGVVSNEAETDPMQYINKGCNKE